MFRFFINKKSEVKLSDSELQSFLSILNEILQILKKANLDAQVQIIQNLLDLIFQKNIEEFKRLINGVDVWGGSGAVWEVYIENKNEADKFEKEIILLINLMENTNILGRGIKPIRKIFEANLRN